MKLVNVGLARSIWLFDTAQANPEGLDLLPVAQAIIERYKFLKYPKSEEVRVGTTGGLEFSGGTFQTEDGEWILVAFTMYADGLTAETRANTRHTDAFLSDLLAYVTKQFRLRFEPSMVTAKRYLSEVVISSERIFRVVDPKLIAFGEYVSRALDFPAPVQPVGFHIGPDPAASEGKSWALRLERKTTTAFDQNLFFSQAPAMTDTHLEVLSKYEEMLG